MRTAQEIRERARQMLKEANEIEKKEKNAKVLQAGELVKKLFESDFTGFNPETFKGQVKGIFTDGVKESESKPTPKAEAQAEEKSAVREPKTEEKKKWF